LTFNSSMLTNITVFYDQMKRSTNGHLKMDETNFGQ